MMRRRLAITSSSASSSSSTVSSSIISSSRTFIIPKQLKAYGGDFMGKGKDQRATFLLPQNELKSLQKITGINNRYFPGTATAVAEYVDSFEDMSLPKEIHEALHELGAEVPSPVQQSAIPAILSAGESQNHNGSMLLAAPHGSGKTFAYLTPLFARLQKDRDVYNIPLRENRPRAIIFAPTQELIWQIHHVCQTFEKHTGLKSLAFTSTKRNHRKWRLMMKNTMPDILILGPSFALRQVEMRRLFLDDLRMVVMDEADELISVTSSRLGARFMSKVSRRLCYRHLWPVNTQTLFVTSGVTNELAGFLKQKHGRGLPTVFTPGMHSPTKSSRHKFIFCLKDKHKLDVLRRTILHAGFEPDPNIADGGAHYIVEEDENGINTNNNHKTRNGSGKNNLLLGEGDKLLTTGSGEEQQQQQDNNLNSISNSNNGVVSSFGDQYQQHMANPYRTGKIEQLPTRAEMDSMSPEDRQELKEELADYDYFDYFMRNGRHPRMKQNKNWTRQDKIIKLQWEHQETTPAPFLNRYEKNESESYKKLMSDNINKKLLIFFSSIDRCTALHWRLKELGFNVTMMHASLPGKVRDANFQKWVSGEIPIMCATDVAARGLDVDISCVINYDMPVEAKWYLNRAGRTGRMGRPGAVVSLFTKKEEIIVSAMKSFLKHDLPVESVSNQWFHMTKPNYAQYRKMKKAKLAKKFVALITRKTIPAHLEKTYIRHNALWRPLWRPKDVESNFGVPVRQSKKIMAKVHEAAVWHRRLRLQTRKAKGGGSAKFGSKSKPGHLKGNHPSQGGIPVLSAGDDPQRFASQFSDKYSPDSAIGPPSEPPR